MKWEVRSIEAGEGPPDDGSGWEPFSVTYEHDDFGERASFIWWRCQVPVVASKGGSGG